MKKVVRGVSIGMSDDVAAVFQRYPEAILKLGAAMVERMHGIELPPDLHIPPDDKAGVIACIALVASSMAHSLAFDEPLDSGISEDDAMNNAERYYEEIRKRFEEGR